MGCPKWGRGSLKGLDEWNWVICPFICLIFHFFQASRSDIATAFAAGIHKIKDFQQDAAALQAIENQMWAEEHDTYEDRIHNLEADRALAKKAHLWLDEQNQENFMLNETIDRVRDWGLLFLVIIINIIHIEISIKNIEKV